MKKRRSITGFTKKELLERTGIKHSPEFNRRFNKVKTSYGLVTKLTNPFKEEIDNEKSDFEIPLEAMPLLEVLLNSIDESPFFRKNVDVTKIDADKIVHFYQSLMEEVETLPKYEKYIIQDHPAYINALKEIDIVPKLIQKISETIVALEQITKQERGDIMIYIYQVLDEWMFKAYQNNTLLEKAKSSNIEKVTEYMGEPLNDITIAQDTIKTLDSLIGERIKMWLGLDGNNESEIKRNVLDSKERKVKLENYIQALTGTSFDNAEEFRENIEDVLLEELYEGQFDTHQQDVDDLIQYIKTCSYEKKLASHKAEKKLDEWKKRDKQQRLEYISQWKESRVTLLKQQIHLYEQIVQSLEDDEIYSTTKVEEEMRQLEDYLQFKQQIQKNKRYEQASNLFVGQLILDELKKQEKSP